MKPRLKKAGCFWIALRPHAEYGWAYDRCHDTWDEALVDALSVKWRK